MATLNLFLTIYAVTKMIGASGRSRLLDVSDQVHLCLDWVLSPSDITVKGRMGPGWDAWDGFSCKDYSP